MANAPALYLFGPPRLERDGQALHIDTRKGYALLAYLAVLGTPQSRDTLAALLYPDSDDTSARAALRRTLSVVNTALDGLGLHIERETLCIDPDTLWVDVIAFERYSTDGALSEAVGLVRGDFLEGFTLRDSPEFDRWQIDQAERFRRRLGHTLENIIQLTADRGAFGEAIPYARRWLELDPLNEAAHTTLMRLYIQNGERSAAIQQYRDCIRILDQELSVAPLAETTALYQAILQNRFVTPSVNTSSDAETPADKSSDAFSTPRLPFVGRGAEIARLHKADSRPGLVIGIEGEAGIGKTRLAEWYIDHQAERGTRTISVTCYEGEGSLVYAPILALLRKIIQLNGLTELPDQHRAEIVRLLPEFQSGAAIPSLEKGLISDPASAQLRLFEAVHQVLRTAFGDKPGLILLDDVHWLDSASLDVLAYLIRRFDEAAPTLLLTWRSEELPKGHMLRRLIGERMRHNRAIGLSLSRFSRGDVAELMRQSIGMDESLLEKVYSETEGLPFFVAEYVTQAGQADGEPVTLSPNTSGLIQSRLARISPSGLQILGAAAVIEHTFDFEMLRAVSGRADEEMIDALEELTGRGLIHETDSSPSAYEFYHEKLRTFIYEELSSARRRLLHRRMASALVSRAERLSDDGSVANRIATHFWRAGQESEAATYFWRAGQYTQGLYAYREAVSYYETALALGYPETSGLHQALGTVYTLLGDYSRALQALETAISTLETGDGSAERAGRLEHQIGSVYQRLGELALAKHHFESALQVFPESALLSRATIFADWSLLNHQEGNADQAKQLADDALALAEQADNLAALAQAHNMLGILARSRGSTEASLLHLTQSLHYAERTSDLGMLIAALNNLALAYRDARDIGQSVGLLKRALEQCDRFGDRHRLAALHNSLADTLHLCGEEANAMHHLKKAVAIFAELGLDTSHRYPEIWKLTEW